MRSAARGLACAALCLASPGLPALADGIDPPRSATLDRYQQREQLLQNIGWQLVRGNAPYCEHTAISIGLTLQDMASFGAPDLARQTLGLKRDFAVQSVAAGSPADEAGIVANQEVIAIAGEAPNSWLAEKNYDWRRLKRAHDLIDAQLARHGRVQLSLGGVEAPLAISGLSVCASKFELASGDKSAKAEGQRIVIGEDFVAFAYAEDELAAAIAHELAHNILRHRAWLDTTGRKRRDIRLTEREADRLMPWLLANAGYDPLAASRFMAKWGPNHSGGFFRARTHDGWDERLEAIAEEVELVEAQVREAGSADWHKHFHREINLP